MRVAEILSHCQRGIAHPEPHARWLVHLPEQHDRLVPHICLTHLTVELFAFARPFADAAEQADAVVILHGVVDQFGQQNRLADAGASKEAGLATAFDRREKVNRLDPGFQDFGGWDAVGQRRRRGMNRTALVRGWVRQAVNRLAKSIQHPAQQLFADWHRDRTARRLYGRSKRQAPCRTQRNAPHQVGTNERRNFQRDLTGFQQIVDPRHLGLKADIDNTAADCSDSTCLHHPAAMPPSTVYCAPVTKAESSDARNKTSRATSSVSP